MSDERYLEIVTQPIRQSAEYRPRFGRSRSKEGLSLDDFFALYREDPFCTWFGLDNPQLYAAHKAAGGMTSVYRQIGLGCERLVRATVQDKLGLSDEDVSWSYEVRSGSGRTRRLRLDGRIPLNAIADLSTRARVADWISDAAAGAGVDDNIRSNLKGVVFEIRQGYKSKDSKRQNADLANAAAAYARALLPCLMLLSTQMDEDIAMRYEEGNWILLTGTTSGVGPQSSTYDFMMDVVGFDLASFFARNRDVLRAEVARVLTILLDPTS